MSCRATGLSIRSSDRVFYPDSLPQHRLVSSQEYSSGFTSLSSTLYSALIRSCADGLFVCLLGGYLTAFYFGRKLEKIKEKRPSEAWIVRQIGKQKGYAMMLSDAMCHSILYPYSMSEATVRLGAVE